jgi:predicted ATPase/class 3 adenylate cyclase
LEVHVRGEILWTVRELPRGTVTFLFTDVEGSTRLLAELGAEAYGNALAEHRRVLRKAFAKHGGVEVDTQGDAFFYAFATAPSALDAARDAQVGLSAGAIRVRMGVHTGTPHLTNEGYVGADVHRAARIAGSGHGGQVLVSAATAALAGTAGLQDLGDHRLRDLSAPERIYQLGGGDFPPLKSLFQTNLPVPSTPFLGREAELADVAELLAREAGRLITLTGSGGTGKTRLALQAAALASDGYPEGVWWVSLAALRDPELVMPTAAQALGAQGAVVEHIGDRRMLILFDNFEQVIDAGPDIADMLGACPKLDLLVTSRERLHLAAEQEYAVPPLTKPEGVAFFLARAQAVKPDFESDDVAEEICRRLDHLPLALELAAARVKALSPVQILARLESRLPLLTRGSRDLPERQRTLKGAIDWSHELLSAEEQQLFRRLAVFSGGCTLDSAETVADADLDGLQSLVDKSLLRHSHERYWMLESIREYASGHLQSSGEAADLQTRHAHHFLERAESAGLSLEPLVDQSYDLASQEIDNIRAALTWSSQVDAELALRLATALDAFWLVTDPSEGMRWYGALLTSAVDAPLALRARALLAYGGSANPAGDDELAERLYQQSYDAFSEVGDENGMAVTLLRLGYSAFYRGDNERAGQLALDSLALSRKVGYRAVEAQALGLGGEVEYTQGNREKGAELMEESANLAGEVGFPWWRSRMLRKLVDCTLALGRASEAHAWARESLSLVHEVGDRQMTVFALARLARLAAESGRKQEAGLIWGAIEAEEERSRMGAWAKERERLSTPVLAHAGPEFELGREQGRKLALEEAVQLGIEV